MHSRIHRYAPFAYLLLASIYLVYLPHVEFVLDDWLVLARYQTAREEGTRSLVQTGLAILQNQFHNQFRFQFLSYESAFWLFLAVGYSPKIVFVLFLALHAACAMALRSVIERLGLGAGQAFLAGALFLLLPTAHGVIFWPHNCCYYLWSTFWLLLYLRALIPSLQSETLGWKAARPQIAFLLLALFSGDPVFCLLLAGAPLTAWYLRSRAGVRATLLAWATVGITAPLYAVLINRAPIVQQGLQLRFRWTWRTPWRNLSDIVDTYARLAGLGERAFYQIRWTGPAVAAAALAVLVTIIFVARANGARAPTARALLLAAGLWAAACGPILFLGAHEFRYDYVPGAYLAVALAAVACAWRPIRLPLSAILLGWCALAAVADIDQCWTVQSRNLRAIADGLRGLHPVERGELIILSNAPEFVGTAPHFVLLAGWASTPYAERVTGVRGLEVACEIVDEDGRLRVFHRDHMRDLNPAELAKTVVLVQEGPRFSRRRLLADPVNRDLYRVYALKGYEGPPVPLDELSRAQMALAESEIYFARPFSHRHGH